MPVSNFLLMGPFESHFFKNALTKPICPARRSGKEEQQGQQEQEKKKKGDNENNWSWSKKDK